MSSDRNYKFQETKDHEYGFAKHYEIHVKPHVKNFENCRIKYLKKAKVRILIVLSTFLVVPTYIYKYHINSILLENDTKEVLKTLLNLTWIAIFFAVLFIRQPIKKFSLSVKSNVFPSIISFFKGFTYKPTEEGSKRGKSPIVDKLTESGIIPSYNEAYSEDFIEGIYQGIKIELFETRLVKDQGRYQSTPFRGLIVKLSINKKFQSKTIIKKDRGMIRNLFNKKSSILKKVSLEDPLFEKLFEVYSSNQIEARYLLTTSFMERLIILQSSLRAKEIECSFFDNTLMIKIPLPEKIKFFETGSIFKPKDFTKECREILSEVNNIQEIVNILKLNHNIGL